MVVPKGYINIWLPKRDVPKSPFKRVEQWLTFARQWHLLDARWQTPEALTSTIVPVLEGRNKPIYHPDSDCGDHVVVYNTRHVAMEGFDWKRVRFWFNNRYPKGKHAFQSWLIHQHQPTRLVSLSVYTGLSHAKNYRRAMIERLHLFPDDTIPDEILVNVSNQLPQPTLAPRRFTEYSEREVDEFPALFDFPDDYTQEYDGPFGR